MGSPISGIIAELFLQQLENSHIKFLLESTHTHTHTAFNSCYVDDILIIYDASCTNTNAIVQYANAMHNSLHFAPTLESNNQISFVDPLIMRKLTQLEIDIFRKPTMTDTTINYISNHPTEHKIASYRY